MAVAADRPPTRRGRGPLASKNACKEQGSMVPSDSDLLKYFAIETSALRRQAVV